MLNRDLIKLLEQLDPEMEVGIEIQDTHTGKHVDITYALGFKVDENDGLILIVDTEKEKF